MNLTKEYTSLRVASPTFYMGGEPVTILRRGGNRWRVERPDGSTLLIDPKKLTEFPGSDVAPADEVEKVARTIEQEASDTRRKFAQVSLTEGQYVRVTDRRGVPYGKPYFEELKTQDEARRLIQRLERGGLFQVVKWGANG